MPAHKFKLSALTACLALASNFCFAQDIRTIFAHRLHIVANGEFQSGGVAWAPSSLGLPNSWSSEANGNKIQISSEISRSSEGDQKARLSGVLSGVANWSPVKVSSYSGWQGVVGNKAILGVNAKDSFWIALVEGPDAEQVLASVSLERRESPVWLQRSIPGEVMLHLPYELAPDRSREGRYELKFEDFQISLDMQTAQQDSKFDIKKTVDSEVDSYKKNKGYTDVKVNRMRIRELSDGEYARIDFKESGRQKSHVYLAGVRNGRGVQMQWDFDTANVRHNDYSNRMLLSYKPSKDQRSGFHRWQAGSHPFSFEVMGDPTSTRSDSGNEEWVSDPGQMLVTCRVIENSTQNTDSRQAAEFFVSLAQTQSQKGTDFKSELVPYVVNGVHGMLAKCTYKVGSMKNIRHGLFLSTADGIFVLDALGIDQSQVEHVIGSAQIKLKNLPKGIQEYTFKESSINALNLQGTPLTDSPPEGPYKTIQMVQSISAGELVLTQISQIAKDKQSILTDKVTLDTIDAFAKGMKAKMTLLHKGWGSDGPGLGYWVAYTLELEGKKYDAFAHSISVGDSYLFQNVIYFTDNNVVRSVGQKLMNGYGVRN